MDIEPDVAPLMSAKADSSDAESQPMLPTREWRGGRVAFDGLDHDADALNHPIHRRSWLEQPAVRRRATMVDLEVWSGR